jgi:alpha-tubulin suppressor-like RCC1 family protein
MLRRFAVITSAACIFVAGASQHRASAASKPASDAALLRVRAAPASVTDPLVMWGSVNGALQPTPISISLTAPVKEVAVSRSFAVVVDERHSVWCLLGSHVIALPHVSKLNVVSIACTERSFFALTDRGSLYEIALPSKPDATVATPPPINAADFRIASVDVGRHRIAKVAAASNGDNVALLTTDGKVLSRGNNEFGQLGQRSTAPFVGAFAPVFTHTQAIANQELLAEKCPNSVAMDKASSARANKPATGMTF